MPLTPGPRGRAQVGPGRRGLDPAPRVRASTRTQLTSINASGRGRDRTADRWCVNPSLTVRRVSPGAIASSNTQVSGSFVSTVSTDCRAVFARLGTLLAQRGFGRQAPGRVCAADLPIDARPHDPPTCGAKGTRTPDPHTAQGEPACAGLCRAVLDVSNRPRGQVVSLLMCPVRVSG
jgi:hypothetical protein